MSQVPSRRKSRPWEDDTVSDDGMQHHQGKHQADQNDRFTSETWSYSRHGSSMNLLQAAPTLTRAKFQGPTWERPKTLSYQTPEVSSPAPPSLPPGHQQAIQDYSPSLSKRRRISEGEACQCEGDSLGQFRKPNPRNRSSFQNDILPALPYYPPYVPLHLNSICPTNSVRRISEAPPPMVPVPPSPPTPSPVVMPHISTQSAVSFPSPTTQVPRSHQGYQPPPLLPPLPPPPPPNAPHGSHGKLDFDSQFLRLSQENQELREELRKATLEFTPGKNLRGIVAQLFEVAEEYAEVLTTQQQQVQDALEVVDDLRVGITSRGIATTENQTPVPQRKAISDNDLKTQDNVVAYLRGIHTTLRSKLNSLKRVGAMTARVCVLERGITGKMASVDAIQTELRKENQTLKLKVNLLEREKTWLEDRVRYLEQENEGKSSRDFITNISSASTNISTSTPPSNPITLLTSNPQPPYQNKQSQHPPVLPSKIRPAPVSPSTATSARPTTPSTTTYNETLIAPPTTPSTTPSTTTYSETFGTLQHRLSAVQLELETLRSEHARLCAALQRSQARALVLEKKNAVYSDENDTLSTERDRYQMLYETVEDQLSEVTDSRDEYRRQAVAGGGQYSSILAMATRLERQGVEDRKRWKEEKEGLEKEKLELQKTISEKEVDNVKLRDEVGLLNSLGKHRGVEAECLVVESSSVHGALLHSAPLTAEPLSSQGNCDLSLTNRNLCKRIQSLENTIREIKREGLAIIRTAEKIMTAGET